MVVVLPSWGSVVVVDCIGVLVVKQLQSVEKVVDTSVEVIGVSVVEEGFYI